MASGIFYGSTNDPNIRVKIEWLATPDPVRGESNVSASLWLRTISETVSAPGKFSINVGGATMTESRSVTITSDTWVKAITYGTKYPHGEDGLATAEILAEGEITGDKDISASVSGKAKLDYIPGASSITSASDTVLGEKCVIKWIPASADYVYRLKFSIGEWEEVTEIISPNTTSEYVYSDYNIPLDVAAQIEGVKGSMVVSLYTYLSEDSQEQVKQPKTTVITVTVPDNDDTKPTMMVMVAPDSTLPYPFNTLYLKGRTKVKALLSEGSGKYGASVVSRYMTVGGKTYSEPYISDFLPTSGTTEVVCTVTDTRGFTREYSSTITVIDYDAPILLPALAENTVICARCDSTGALSESGTHLKIKARRGFSPVVASGVQNNRCAIRYRCVEDESSIDGDVEWVVILDEDSDTDTVDTVIDSVTLLSENAYTVQIGVIDSLGMSSTLQFAIPTDFATIDIPSKHKGKRIGIGRYAEDSDEPGIDVGMPIHGGGVDNLTLGELINASEEISVDLDDIKESGNYYSPSGANISNAPTSGGFSLIVRELEESGIRQTFIKGEETWLRSFNKGKWGEWAKVITQIDTAVVADYVVESGTSEGWVYKKWSGGSYEMHGAFDVEITDRGQSVGGNLYRSEEFSIKLPFTAKTAIMSATASMWTIPTLGELEGDYLILRLLKSTTFTVGQTIKVSILLFGTYQLQEENI